MEQMSDEIEKNVEAEGETITEEQAEAAQLANDEEGTEEVSEDNVVELNSEETKTPEEDFKEKYYYLAAEMENMRKRNERDKESLLKYGNEKILSGLIDVVDNLDRTLEALVPDEDEKVKNIVAGVEMVRKQFTDVLTNNGLEIIETLGKIFDPNFHEALAQQPAEGKEDQEIITEYQKGYVLNGRLLRAAKVVIVKND